MIETSELPERPTQDDNDLRAYPPQNTPNLPTAGYCPSLSGMCETLGESARRERLLIEAITSHLEEGSDMTINGVFIFQAFQPDGKTIYCCGHSTRATVESAIEAALCAAVEGEGERL